jgi:hypothetical protein
MMAVDKCSSEGSGEFGILLCKAENMPRQLGLEIGDFGFECVDIFCV